MHGDFQKRLHAYKPKPTETNIISIRSLVWPGLVHVVTPVAQNLTQDLQIKTVYVGSGKKYSSSSYFPKFAYLIHAEPQELTEHQEPNGEQEHIAIAAPGDGDDGQPADAGADDQGDN